MSVSISSSMPVRVVGSPGAGQSGSRSDPGRGVKCNGSGGKGVCHSHLRLGKQTGIDNVEGHRRTGVDTEAALGA